MHDSDVRADGQNPKRQFHAVRKSAEDHQRDAEAARGVPAAKLAGLEAILVDPLVRGDPWNTRPLRWLERIVMRGVPRV